MTAEPAVTSETSTRTTRKPGIVRRAFVWLSSVIWFVSILALFIATAFALGGFVRFTYTASQISENAAQAAPTADGFVVLTGGEDRIKRAVQAMRSDEGKRLLITGVNPATDLDAIAETNDLDERVLTCCVDIDRTALDTRGNANAAALWAEQNGYKSLVVVTSNIHMPRSLLEFRRAMPEIELIALPVEVYNLRENSWVGEPMAWKALVTEYGKFVAAHLRKFVGDGMVRWAAKTVRYSTA